MTSVRDRLEEALSRIADPSGEGARAFIRVSAERARAEADAADARRRNGLSLGPLDGVITSVKDLYDTQGEVTTVGSALHAADPPKPADAPAVARLRASGAVIVGKTNLTEFAFHTLGSNINFGTPGNPADRARFPGGSSSGAAVAVVDGMCEVALGSDTAGSIRVPAALCGCVGFKPTQKRVPLDGAFPLSTTLDSAGPLTRTVALAHAADAVLAGEPYRPLRPAPLRGLRIGVPRGSYFLDELEPEVASAFEAALKALERAGAALIEVDLKPQLQGMAELNAKGGFSAVEANHIHRAWLPDAAKAAKVDPFVVARIERGKGVSAVDYIEMMHMRRRLIAEMDLVFDAVDAIAAPTTPIRAPLIASVTDVDSFIKTAFALLRNTFPGNVFDLCAVSLPLPVAGLPVGFMLMGRHGGDARLLQIAGAAEPVLTR
jgi:aspartyl-tRNA(Asn)/glutamyl-tRNA(Gln) amidotransferase subunit A